MTKKIVVTGALGQIAYSLLFRIGAGELLGKNEPIILSLLEAQEVFPSLQGIRMELEDAAFPLLKEIELHCKPEEAFDGADLLFFIGAKPRGPGMERKDLLKENAKIFIEQGKALKNTKKDALALVVGNPCNTNALLLAKQGGFDKRRIFSMMTLDELRARSLVARTLQTPISSINKLFVWGNHSLTQVIDYTHAFIGKEKLEKRLDRAWCETTFQESIQKRGAEVIQARGKSSAASAANAALVAMRNILFPTEKDEVFSMGIYSEGNPYGIDEDLFYSFPCRSEGNGKVSIAKDLKPSSFIQEKMKLSEKELLEERRLALL